MPYIEGLVFASRSCTLQIEGLEIHFLQEILLTVTREPCTQSECGFHQHIFSQTENAFSGHVNLTLYKVLAYLQVDLVSINKVSQTSYSAMKTSGSEELVSRSASCLKLEIKEF